MTLRDPFTKLEARFVQMRDNAAIAIKRQLVGAMKSGTLASSKLCDVSRNGRQMQGRADARTQAQ